MFHASWFHEEVLLYYCEEEFWNIGSFEFVDLTEDMATPTEWRGLTEGHGKLLKRIAAMERLRKEWIKKQHRIRGEEVPEDPNTGLAERLPKFKFAAIVVNGVRH